MFLSCFLRCIVVLAYHIAICFNSNLWCVNEWVRYCCLTPRQHLSSYLMARTRYRFIFFSLCHCGITIRIQLGELVKYISSLVLPDQGSSPRSSILEAIIIHQDKYSLKYLHYIMITKVNTLKIKNVKLSKHRLKWCKPLYAVGI
jgi:hypothetical protein